MGGLVKGLFGGPDIPPPPAVEPAPPPPTIDDATKMRESEDAARRRKGRAATILTGKQGTGAPTTAAKALTGG